MKKKWLSLFLVVCMLLPSFFALPLSQLTIFAAETRALPVAGTTVSFPGANNENLPVLNADKTVSFRGGWIPFTFQHGQYNVSGIAPMVEEQNPTIVSNSITREKYLTDLWKQYASMTLVGNWQNGYLPTSGQLNVTNWNSAGIRYTVEANATIDINLTKIGNAASSAAGKDCFRYAILLNGEMIWPAGCQTLEDLQPLSSKLLSNVSAVSGIEVAVGDKLDFIVEGVGLDVMKDWDGYGNVIQPSITYQSINKIHTSLALGLGSGLTVYGTLKLGETDVTEAGIAFNGVDYKGELQSNGTYRVKGISVNAKNAIDNIAVQAYYIKNGTRTTGKAVSTSVASLLHAYTESTDGAAMKYAEIAAATLDYISEAQTYFGYETGSLANGGSPANTAVKGTYDPEKLFTVTSLAGATVAPAEIALLLRDTVGIHIKIAALGGKTVNMSGYKLEVSDNAAFTSAALVPVVEKNGQYKAEMLGITARLWNDSFFFRVVDASGKPVSSTFTYGVSAYYARMSENDGVCSLVSSMMVLYEATQTKAGGSSMNASSPAMIQNPQAGTVITNSSLSLSGTANYAGKVLVASGNVTISGNNATLKNLTVFAGGTVTIQNASGTTFENVQIHANAIRVASTCSGISFYDCRFVSTVGNAIENAAPTLTAYHSYFATTAAGITAIRQNASDGLFEDCVIYANGGLAVELSGNDNTIRACTLRGGVSSLSRAENLLVGGCFFRGANDTVNFTAAHNSAVVLNDLTNVTLVNGTSNYVVNNNIYGTLTLDNCHYLLANNNNLNGNLVNMVSCRNYNGDTVVDVTARNAYGVNEDLLPKVDDDVHINMTRKTTVRVPYGMEMDIAEYINTHMESGKTLILAPGAYQVKKGTNTQGNIFVHNKIFLDGLENADLYAYGVLYERQTYKDSSLDVYNSKNVSFYGLTMGMTVQSSGIVIVVAKNDATRSVTVLKGAGVFWDETDGSSYFFKADHESIYRKYDDHSYGDIASQSRSAFDQSGFATFTYSAPTYDQIQVGDVITCRQSVSLTYLYRNEGLFFEDVTVVGGSVRCFWDDYAEKGTTLNRVIDKPMPAKVISQSEYNTYKNYEAKYGVYTGVYQDASGNYRGTPSRTATADFAHSAGSKTGFTVTNSLVSGLSDDGTNNQGFKDRVADYDAATGTLTLANDNGWGDGVPTSGYDEYPSEYEVGENVLIYTSTGKLIAETVVLAAGDQFTATDAMGNTGKFATIKIPAEAIASGALDGFDLGSPYSDAHKIFIHSLDRMGDGIFFDNVKFENIRSRAALVKSTGVTIKNCSFYDIGMAAIGMNFEIRYGESGFVRDVVIQNNYFENTGYFNNYTYYSPISVDAPTVQGEDDYLLSSNIRIEGNVIRNRGTTNALFLRGVNNVVIANNNFGKIKDTGTGCDVFGLFVKSVLLSGNTYSTGHASTATVFTGYRNVIGRDLRLDEDPTMSTTRVDAYEESRAYLNANKELKFKGNWSIGYVSYSSGRLSYGKYGKLESTDPNSNSSCYIIHGSASNIWDSAYGGMGNIARDYRFMPSASYASAFCYTAPEAGTVTFSLSNFYTPYEKTATIGGSGDGLFAIFNGDGTMVWPTQGGSYNSTSQWYAINHNTSHAALNASLSEVRVSVEAGETLYFVGRRANSSVASYFSAVPVVYYLAPQKPNTSLEDETPFDSIFDIFF